MEEEIQSQRDTLVNLVKRYVKNYCVTMDFPLGIKNIVIVASGSSYNAGIFGKYFFETISQVETKVEYACEFSNSNFDNYSNENLYLFISQSGNSSDVVNAINKVKAKGIKTFALVNNPDSQAYKLSDYKVDIQAGTEKAIAATKSYSATVLALWLMSIKLAQSNKIDVSEEIKNINFIGNDIIDNTSEIENLFVAAKLISKQKTVSIIGHKLNYPLALEAGLKIKETSYVNTNPYPIGDFIHGHFATLNEQNVFIVFLNGIVSDFEKKLIKKIHSTYNTKSIVISDGYEDFNCDILVKYPQGNSKISSILNAIVTLQILALENAKILKRDVDNPKGLCKVVSHK